jgi:hypothetical protein
MRLAVLYASGRFIKLLFCKVFISGLTLITSGLTLPKKIRKNYGASFHPCLFSSSFIFLP